MRLQNTTSAQDAIISGAGLVFERLVEVIEQFDEEITKWREVALILDASTPEELATKIHEL